MGDSFLDAAARVRTARNGGVSVSGAGSRAGGFTLYELVLVVSIAAILAALSFPLRTAIQDHRLIAEVNQLMAHLMLARNEAVRRGTTVTLCKSADAATCTTDSNWHGGWIVFADPNDNQRRDAGEALIRARQPLETGVRVDFRAAFGRNDDVSYAPSGFTQKNGTFTLCDPRGGSAARAVILYRSGRPRTATRTASGGRLRCD